MERVAGPSIVMVRMKPLEVKGIDTVQITVGSEFEKHLGEPISFCKALSCQPIFLFFGLNDKFNETPEQF